MQPTLQGDDVLLVNKLSKHFKKDVDVGSLYIFTSPTDPEKLICKRVTAKVYYTNYIVISQYRNQN